MPEAVGYPRPTRRLLQIYALDPMRMENTGAGFITPRTLLSVPYEPLLPGPIGDRIHVIDYDGARRSFYAPVDLDDRHVLATNGLAPSETDPRFHQQMVYAVASSVWEAFEAALGRRIGLSGGPLRIFPHAFYGENAFYDPRRRALLFGYFRADDRDPGPNLPGQMVFTCLSHDIIAHETTHAIVDRLRPRLDELTNPDVAAFHEAFADLVAIFQHFKIEQVLIDAINEHKADLTSAEAISSLARQFGFASAQQAPLRSALDDDRPDPTVLQRTWEPHARGVVLVQAVFDAYRTTYLARVQDLLRLATGGSGILQEGRPHPDLVRRLAQEATTTARLFFDRCVQAIAYLPPIDVTFGDFLCSLVTADSVASPTDDAFRTAIIEAFRRRGIYGTDAGSLAGSAVAWPTRSDAGRLPAVVDALLGFTARASGSHQRPTASGRNRLGKVAVGLERWCAENAVLLGLAPHDGLRPIEVVGFHSTVRVDVDGQLQVDTVVQAIQRRRDLAREPRFAGIMPKAGVTIIADARRVIRHVITKPLSFPDDDPVLRDRATRRGDQLVAMVESFDMEEPAAAYGSNGPSRLRMDFARLHGGFDRREAW